MRTLALVVGILILVGGALAGCSLGIVTISFFEPPSPSWNFRPEVGGASHHETPPLSAGPHVVWIDQPPSSSRCKLTVRRSNGKLVGTNQGGRLCTVSGEAQPGEVWSIDADAADGANGALADDKAVALPTSLKLSLSGAALAMVLGIALIGLGVRRQRG